MTSDTVSTFEDSLRSLDVAWTHTDVEGFESTLRDLVDDPAVGVPLPFEGLTLPGDVNTSPTPSELVAAETGITAASIAVADYGTLILESTPEGAEPTSLFPTRHVAVLRASDVVPDMPAAFEWLGPRLRSGDGGDRRSERAPRGSAILATGPSATADMGELVKGVHGPKVVHVLIVDDLDDAHDDRSEADE